MANVPDVVMGEPETDKKPGTVAATEVTVPEPEPPDALMVWLGQVPVMVTLVPATRAGVAVPEPPLATGKMPVTPVLRGSPVRLVAVPLDGVPKAPPLVKYEPAGCLLLNVFQSVDVK